MPRKGLDILGQKSWHVLRRHNIERVRKDQREEKEANEKEKEKEENALFEGNLQKLRNKNSTGELELPKLVKYYIEGRSVRSENVFPKSIKNMFDSSLMVILYAVLALESAELSIFRNVTFKFTVNFTV